MNAQAPIETFLARLAAAEPTPGGGAAAALGAAIAAALLQMYAGLSARSKRVAPDWQTEFHRVASEAEQWRTRVLHLMDVDAAAFDEVMRALRLPRETPEEKAHRTRMLTHALLRAAEIPLETAEIAAKVMRACAHVLGHGIRSALSDLESAYQIARSAMACALVNVAINLENVQDTAVPEDLRRRYDAACTALRQMPPYLWNPVWATSTGDIREEVKS